MMMMVHNEIAAALMFALGIEYPTVIDCWGPDGNDVSSLYLGPSKSLLESRALGKDVANSTGYFDSDFVCKFVHRYMEYDAGLYRPFVSLDNTRCMCTDTETD